MNEEQHTQQPPAPQPEPGVTPEDRPTEVLGTPVGEPGTGYQPPQAANPPSGGYPPPQPGYQPAGGYAPPQTTYQPTGAYPPPEWYPRRRLTRSRTERMVGGVCGGLARYWNTDPVLLRILTVVLTLATGGALLIGYILAWILIPDEPMAPLGPYGQTPGAEQVGYAAGGNPGYAEYATQYAEPAPRERSYLGWLILSAAVLVVGVISLLSVLAPADITMWGVAGGIALAVMGIGMLVGTWYGRARWVAFLAVPLAFLTFGVITAERWVQDNPNWERWADGSNLSVGDAQWAVTPEELTGAPLVYELSAGDAVLDLTGLTAIGDSEPGKPRQRVTIDAGVGLGQLVVLIPDDMVLDLEASVDVGEITVPGVDPLSGADLDLQATVDQVAEGAPAFIVQLDAAIGAGNLEVRHEAS